jgi:hypothetical protein
MLDRYSEMMNNVMAVGPKKKYKRLPYTMLRGKGINESHPCNKNLLKNTFRAINI